MFMKKTPKSIQQIFVAAVVILILSSCQKEATNDIDTSTQNPSTNLTKVKTYTEDATSNGGHYVETFNLTYDGNNRLLSLISTSNPGNKLVYQYNADNTYTMDIYEGGVLSIHELFFVNNLPFVDSTLQFDAPRKDTTTEKYIYNSNKQLVTLKEYDYSKATGSTLLNQVNYQYDNAGNQVKELHKTATITYDYYPDRLNNLFVGLIYFQQSKNLLKTTTYIVPGALNEVINHTYTFDSSDRVTSEKAVDSNGDVSIKSYTYY